MITKENANDYSFRILLLHTLYPTLNRSIRSRVEGYRGLVNRFLLETPIPMHRKDSIPYLRIMSVASSFPSIGIDPPLSISKLKQLQHYLLYMQEDSDPMIEYYVALGLYGLHRQLEDHDVHVQAVYQNPDLFITLRSSLNRTLTYLNISCELDSHPLPLLLEGFHYHTTVLLDPGDHFLHVTVSKHSSIILQEETVLLPSPPISIPWQMVVITTVLGCLMILLLFKWYYM